MYFVAFEDENEKKTKGITWDLDKGAIFIVLYKKAQFILQSIVKKL